MGNNKDASVKDAFSVGKLRAQLLQTCIAKQVRSPRTGLVGYRLFTDSGAAASSVAKHSSNSSINRSKAVHRAVRRAVRASSASTASEVSAAVAAAVAAASSAAARGRFVSGITQRLKARVYSDFDPPALPGAGFRGRNGQLFFGGDGTRRGAAVDRQVSRLANQTESDRRAAKKLVLSKVCFDALAWHGLVPVLGQRVCADAARRIGTAVDIVCVRHSECPTHQLFLIELKCGYVGPKTQARAKMKFPFQKVSDSYQNRHFVQLAATHALFVQDCRTMLDLWRMGITEVCAAVLYVNNEESELHPLPTWFQTRGPRILDAISTP
jgi:hypothetical protein